jgi:hypothetical protein
MTLILRFIATGCVECNGLLVSLDNIAHSAVCCRSISGLIGLLTSENQAHVPVLQRHPLTKKTNLAVQDFLDMLIIVQMVKMFHTFKEFERN